MGVKAPLKLNLTLFILYDWMIFRFHNAYYLNRRLRSDHLSSDPWKNDPSRTSLKLCFSDRMRCNERYTGDHRISWFQNSWSPLFRDLVVGFNWFHDFQKKIQKIAFFFKNFHKKSLVTRNLDAFIFLVSYCHLMNIKISLLKITICGKKVNKHVTKCYFNRKKITMKNAQKVDFWELLEPFGGLH